jgi:NAD(P)-dependent dehydrogenase (short-subunit alcohol dehydrogenase family)
MRVLVVGASSGIGLATARLFAGRGARLALAARSGDRLRALADQLGNDAAVIVADVADDESCRTIVPAGVRALGGLDAMVYCAGICEPRLLKDLTVAEFRRHLDVNLTGNFIAAQAAALHMREAGGGAIVNIASELSHVGMGYYVHYCAAKAGVLGLTRALAAEMAPAVRVNAVSPGPVDTPMLREEIEYFGGTQAVLDGAVARVPMKRFATPEEVARAVLFLATEASFATGSTLMLDGGTTMV